MASCAEIAAQIHADMCDDDSNGYSWAPRWGGDAGWYKTLTIDGRDYSYPVGSYDCSSSVITAWKLAIQYTDYAGALDDATYTGNMRWVFENSGLFYSSSDYAKRGDIYLNDSHHTAMCQDGGNDGVFGYDALSQFSINEFGEVYGGEVGDQTGREAYIGAYYNYPWNETLHYNGKADSSQKGGSNPIKEVEPLQKFTAPIDGGSVYRLYNEVTGEHFFTSSQGERDSLLQDSNWKNEGDAWQSPSTAIPVYRLYNPTVGEHFYTTSTDEADGLVSKYGWVSEGINFVSKPNGTPVYRLYNPNATRGTHMFTTSSGEKQNLLKIGWLDEGIAFYV